MSGTWFDTVLVQQWIPAVPDLKENLERGAHVVERALEEHDGVGAGLLAGALEGAVHDRLSDGTLAVEEHLVDELGDQDVLVDGVGLDVATSGRTFARHAYSPPFFAP